MVVVPAVAAAIAGPILTLGSARIERRVLLWTLSALVLTSDLVAAAAPNFEIMLVARALLGVCIGGFWVFGAGAAMSLVREEARGTAIALVSSGIFLATVAALPTAALIGNLTSWRVAFAIAASLAGAAIVLQMAALPCLGTGVPVHPANVADDTQGRCGTNRPYCRGCHLLRLLRRLHLHQPTSPEPGRADRRAGHGRPTRFRVGRRGNELCRWGHGAPPSARNPLRSWIAHCHRYSLDRCHQRNAPGPHRPRTSMGRRVRCGPRSRANLDGSDNAGQRRRGSGPVRLRAPRFPGRRVSGRRPAFQHLRHDGSTGSGCCHSRRRLARARRPKCTGSRHTRW